jgi:uncharacterized protein
MHPEPLRDRLRAALPAALKSRDRATASTLRATLAAIDNAEAVPVPAGAPRAGAIEASRVGVGAAETARRELTEADVAAIVRGEIEEHHRAAGVFEKSGRDDRAAELRAAAAMLAGFLE